jgi:hypothetical protein
MPSSNVTLYANWIVPSVSLRYLSNTAAGGTGTAPASSGTFYPAYSNVDVVGNTFTNTNGYLFGGWNTAANGSGTYYPAGSQYAMPGSGSVTLYAQWINTSVPQVTLTYDGNGGSGSPPPGTPATYSANAPATILGNTGPYSNGALVFYGWNTAADGSGTSYPAGSTITMNTSKTLYAQWVSNTSPYIVTYDANGATGGAVPAAPTNYPGGVQVPILGQGSLTRPGYTFLGWNGSPTGAGSLYAPGYTFASKTTTLYAQWAPGSVVKDCGGGSGIGSFTFTYPFAQAIASTDTITIYTTALYGSTSTNYGSGLAPEGIISVTSKVVITSATITINTNTTYLNSANDYNYAYTITNGSGVTYWPSGSTLAPVTPVTFPTLSNTTNSLPVTYRLSNRDCTDGCGLRVTAGGGVYSPTISSLAFFNQGVTLNYSNGTNTVFIASPTNAFYSVTGGATPVWTTTPSNFYPYYSITPRSSAALTTITIIQQSPAPEYVYPPMPDYTVEYTGNGATGGNIPPPRYFLPYNTTPSPAPNPAPPAPPNTLPYTIPGNTGLLTKSTGPSTFSKWNTAADGSGTNYGPGTTNTDYAGGASLILYAIWV